MKRIFIRSFFIGLLVLIAGGWDLSFRYYWQIEYEGKNIWELRSNWGEIRFWYISLGGSRRLDFTCQDASPNESNGSGIAGFYFGLCKIEGRVRGFAGRIPFWFPTTLSAALLWWVWRRTRPKINPAKAFPVEMEKPKGDKP